MGRQRNNSSIGLGLGSSNIKLLNTKLQEFVNNFHFLNGTATTYHDLNLSQIVFTSKNEQEQFVRMVDAMGQDSSRGKGMMLMTLFRL